MAAFVNASGSLIVCGAWIEAPATPALSIPVAASPASTFKVSRRPNSSLSRETRAANLASAAAAVKSDKLTVQGAEQAVQDSKLYAPEDGTIVELSGEVGETVTATGTSKASANWS